MDDDDLADDLDRQADGWERWGDRSGYPLWPKYVELLRAAAEAVLDGTLDRTIEETREQRRERIAREKRREASNLDVLRAAIG